MYFLTLLALACLVLMVSGYVPLPPLLRVPIAKQARPLYSTPDDEAMRRQWQSGEAGGVRKADKFRSRSEGRGGGRGRGRGGGGRGRMEQRGEDWYLAEAKRLGVDYIDAPDPWFLRVRKLSKELDDASTVEQLKAVAEATEMDPAELQSLAEDADALRAALGRRLEKFSLSDENFVAAELVEDTLPKEQVTRVYPPYTDEDDA